MTCLISLYRLPGTYFGRLYRRNGYRICSAIRSLILSRPKDLLPPAIYLDACFRGYVQDLMYIDI